MVCTHFVTTITDRTLCNLTPSICIESAAGYDFLCSMRYNVVCKQKRDIQTSCFTIRMRVTEFKCTCTIDLNLVEIMV